MRSVLLCLSETLKADMERFSIVEHTCIHIVGRMWWENFVSNSELRFVVLNGRGWNHGEGSQVVGAYFWHKPRLFYSVLRVNSAIELDLGGQANDVAKGAQTPTGGWRFRRSVWGPWDPSLWWLVVTDWIVSVSHSLLLCPFLRSNTPFVSTLFFFLSRLHRQWQEVATEITAYQFKVNFSETHLAELFKLLQLNSTMTSEFSLSALFCCYFACCPYCRCCYRPFRYGADIDRGID